MPKSQLHIPIAFKRVTNELVNVKDVPNGLACDCYCASCKQDLIAVNKEIKQKAHFRHDSGSDCLFNSSYESYIHWLAKEVLKTCKKIKLPSINFGRIPGFTTYEKTFIERLKVQLRAGGILEEFPENHFYFANICLQSSQEVQISNTQTEKSYLSPHGEIRVDVVFQVGNTDLFVEPFFTNPVKDEKLFKIAALDTSTISLNLLPFVQRNDYLFTVEEFKNYLETDDQSKEWVWVRDTKAKRLINQLLMSESINTKIDDMRETLLRNRELEKQIIQNQDKASKLWLENQELQKGIKDVRLYELFNDFNNERGN